MAEDAPALLREWWLAPVGSGVTAAAERGMARIVTPEYWAERSPESWFAEPPQALGAWQLILPDRARWAPAPESGAVPDTSLRAWFATFWVMDVIFGA